MTVFSSLQSLAEDHRKACEYGEDMAWTSISHANLRLALVDAWPLLEAAVKALEEIAVDTDILVAACHARGQDASDFIRIGKQARAALSSLTGEPR